MAPNATREAFISLLTKLVEVGVSGPLAFNLLGDLTTNLDGLANEDDEEAFRLDLWQLACAYYLSDGTWTSLKHKKFKLMSRIT